MQLSWATLKDHPLTWCGSAQLVEFLLGCVPAILISRKNTFHKIQNPNPRDASFRGKKNSSSSFITCVVTVNKAAESAAPKLRIYPVCSWGRSLLGLVWMFRKLRMFLILRTRVLIQLNVEHWSDYKARTAHGCITGCKAEVYCQQAFFFDSCSLQRRAQLFFAHSSHIMCELNKVIASALPICVWYWLQVFAQTE